MAENVPPSSLASMPPPPPSSAGAPGAAPYDPAPGNNPNNSHMPPPPLPPVVIPQNNNPIPTAMTSPMSGDAMGDVMSPGSAGGMVRRAAPEPNKRALYVGGLDPRVTEDVLRQIFETTGHVQSVKIIPDKNVSKNHLVRLSSPFSVRCRQCKCACPAICISSGISSISRFLANFYSLQLIAVDSFSRRDLITVLSNTTIPAQQREP